MGRFKTFFEENFETKKFFAIFRIIIILFFVLVIFNLTKLTLSKYVSDVDAKIAPNLAFFITDVGTQSASLELGEILPSSDPYFYTINVSNFKDDKRVNVSVEYEIKFILTTNIPLNYKIYKNTSNYSGNGIIDSDVISANDDEMYFRILKTSDIGTFGYGANETNTYVIKVEFPQNYKYNASEYEGVIELVQVVVDAKQKI